MCVRRPAARRRDRRRDHVAAHAVLARLPARLAAGLALRAGGTAGWPQIAAGTSMWQMARALVSAMAAAWVSAYRTGFTRSSAMTWARL